MDNSLIFCFELIPTGKQGRKPYQFEGGVRKNMSLNFWINSLVLLGIGFLMKSISFGLQSINSKISESDASTPVTRF